MNADPAKNDRPGGTFLDRTLRNLLRGWRDIASGRFGFGSAEPDPSLPAADARQLRTLMQECLDARGGEVSTLARAASLGQLYLGLNTEGRARYLRLLAVDFAADEKTVDEAMAAVAQVDGRASRRRAEAALRRALVAPRVRLLTQFNALPEGVKFLVDMRAELLPMLVNEAALIGLAEDLKGLLASWFDVGFLELRRITWDSPAALLEKIVAYEAVHEISNWQDLKNRLDSDRRLFAFFHPRMPDEPLIFVEVALINGMADNVQALLDPAGPAHDPRQADTAVFYSISNAQRGLAGISFGGFLIKRVVDLLTAEFKNLKTFATLSPVPGFCEWLDGRIAAAGGGTEESPFTVAEAKALQALPKRARGPSGLAATLGTEGWHRDEEVAAALKAPLTRLCARYLTTARRPDGTGVDDQVAHFHLSNGARLERINWLADTSARGLQQSAGMMVNYVYRLDQIEDNHEAYTGVGKVAAAASVRNLAKG